jgi:N-acetyl-alpha-D-muramate 1-phosphate uridylyltransferase
LKPVISTAMVLAAGLGKRLRPVTDTLPKPLVKIGGKPMIDWGLDSLEQAGVSKAVVNVHYLADQVEAHLAARTSPHIVFSDERETLLESGGGIIKALPLLGERPFFLINSDTFWLEGEKANLQCLSEMFNSDSMDMLLMLVTPGQATGYEGKGDFSMDKNNRLRRPQRDETVPFVYAGAAIIHPRIFKGATAEPHSLNRQFNEAIAQGKLFGMPMQGHWLTVGTPESIPAAEAVVGKHNTGR